MKYFDSENNRLVFEEKKATPDFWDALWKDDNLKKYVEGYRNDWFVSRITKKFIAPDKMNKILEGGCGKGQYVYSLDSSGYDAHGVDYAAKTVSKINELFPTLKISYGNVENLNFPDGHFTGYWSLGVIEHFYDGYDKMAKEMKRVIGPGGYLFLTFPCISRLRKLKASNKKYPQFEEKNFKKENFYQFALDPGLVQKDFEKLGFELVKKQPLDGIKGLKDEISFLRYPLQKIYSSDNRLLQIFKIVFSAILAPLTGHSILLIFKKQ